MEKYTVVLLCSGDPPYLYVDIVEAVDPEAAVLLTLEQAEIDAADDAAVFLGDHSDKRVRSGPVRIMRVATTESPDDV